MRHLFLFLFLTVTIFPIFAQKNKSTGSLRVMSYNIRYLNTIDSTNSWGNRKAKIVGMLKYHNPDVLGVQEAVMKQLKDLEEQLPEFAWYGVGRMDGKNDG